MGRKAIDTKTLCEKLDENNPDPFIERLSGLIEKNCKKMCYEPTLTIRPCDKVAFVCWEMYNHTKEDAAKAEKGYHVFLNTVKKHLYDMAINCGNNNCGDFMRSYNGLIDYLREVEKEAKSGANQDSK
jgi:hypothetical protein